MSVLYAARRSFLFSIEALQNSATKHSLVTHHMLQFYVAMGEALCVHIWSVHEITGEALVDKPGNKSSTSGI